MENGSKKNNLLNSVLSQNAYWMVNKKIARKIGFNASLFLSDLLSKREYFEIRGQLDEHGGFFNTSDNTAEDTTIERTTRQKLTKALKDIGFIRVKHVRGLPNYYYIDDQKIVEFLSKPENGLVEYAEKRLTTMPENGLLVSRKTAPNNNKAITINNKNKKADEIDPIYPKVVKLFYDNFKPSVEGEKLIIDKKFGNQIKVILKMASNNMSLVETKFKLLQLYIGTGKFIAGDGLLPGTLIVNWHRLKPINGFEVGQEKVEQRDIFSDENVVG